MALRTGGQKQMIHTHFGWTFTPFQKDVQTKHLFNSQRFQEL
jgi:hypothetical protein